MSPRRRRVSRILCTLLLVFISVFCWWISGHGKRDKIPPPEAIAVFGVRIPLFDSRGSDLRILEVIRGLHEAGTQVYYIADLEYSHEVKAAHLKALASLPRVKLIKAWEEDPIPILKQANIIGAMFHHWYWTWPQATIFMKYSVAVRNLPSKPLIFVITDDVHGARFAMMAKSQRSEQLFHQSRHVTLNEKQTLLAADVVVTITANDTARIQDTYGISPSNIRLWRFTYNFAHLSPGAGLPFLQREVSSLSAARMKSTLTRSCGLETRSFPYRQESRKEGEAGGCGHGSIA